MKRINLKKVALTFLPLVVIVLCAFIKPTVTWVAIGDSITYLNDHPSETGNRLTKGYLSDVVAHFDGLYYINKGFNGWTSGNIAAMIDKLGLVKADVYTIFLGTNDWWEGRPIGNLNDYIGNKGNNSVYGSFRIIINKIRRLNPKARILLIAPMQRADFVYINDVNNNAYGSYKPKNGQALSAFADAIDAIGQYEHIPVIDLYHYKKMGFDELINFKRLKDPNTGSYKNYKYPEAANIPFDPSKDEYPYPREAMNLTYDGLHPSDKGDEIIADTIAKVFRQFHLSIAYRATSDNHSRWKTYINLDTYLKPFWKTDTIVDESVLPINDNGVSSARLLFTANKILSVKVSDYRIAYASGKDWNYRNGMLYFDTLSVPFMHPNELAGSNRMPGLLVGGKTPGTYVLLGEGPFFQTKQLSVTYIKEHSATWNGPIPHFAGDKLPVIIGKLKQGKNLKIVFYGNSIEVGHNASVIEGTPPYMPNWADLLIYKLRKTYGDHISPSNQSVSGMMAKWGADSVVSRVVSQKPDLVIIGFGMNDGSGKVPPDVYRKQIETMIDSISAHNHHAEFILIAPMLANPVSVFSGLQMLYKSELDKLAKTGVVVADLTGVHQELLRYKTYQDLTGNNINHPNDYLVRWYAQYLCGLLIKSK